MCRCSDSYKRKPRIDNPHPEETGCLTVIAAFILATAFIGALLWPH